MRNVIQIIATVTNTNLDELIPIVLLPPIITGVIPANPFPTGTIPQGIPQPGTRKSTPIILKASY